MLVNLQAQNVLKHGYIFFIWYIDRLVASHEFVFSVVVVLSILPIAMFFPREICTTVHLNVNVTCVPNFLEIFDVIIFIYFFYQSHYF